MAVGAIICALLYLRKRTPVSDPQRNPMLLDSLEQPPQPNMAFVSPLITPYSPTPSRPSGGDPLSRDFDSSPNTALQSLRQHLVLGYGFSAFWGVGATRSTLPGMEWAATVAHSHNG